MQTIHSQVRSGWACVIIRGDSGLAVWILPASGQPAPSRAIPGDEYPILLLPSVSTLLHSSTCTGIWRNFIFFLHQPFAVCQQLQFFGSLQASSGIQKQGSLWMWVLLLAVIQGWYFEGMCFQQELPLIWGNQNLCFQKGTLCSCAHDFTLLCRVTVSLCHNRPPLRWRCHNYHKQISPETEIKIY